MKSIKADLHLRKGIEAGWNFDGKVAVVTGGTSGIGKDVCIALASLGSRVVIGGRREPEGHAVLSDIEAIGGTAQFLRTDVANESDIRSLVEAAVSSFGRLDLAFNNAGVELGGPMTEITETDYRRVFDINVWGVAAAMKYEISAMMRTGGGNIVNNSSIAGRIGIPGFSLYNASKHAVEGLTKTAALEFARRGIRVNGVAPAFISTPMVDRYVGSDVKRREDLEALHPVGRLGNIREVVAAALFLLSDASPFTIGISLPVDGGWTAQ